MNNQNICSECGEIGFWRGEQLTVAGLCYLCTLKKEKVLLTILDTDVDYYECPICKTETIDSEFPENMLRMTVPNGDNAFYELPSWASDWIETWRCPKCNIIWKVYNANY